ncbi:MAG: type II toxin-antitoxin system HicA family toxin [Candidatus Vogelbacteria bacterium]
MSRLAPLHYRKLVRVFEKLGFVLDRTEGDHLMYTKSGIKRPVVIPVYKAVPVFIINNNINTAGITREEFFNLLNQL